MTPKLSCENARELAAEMALGTLSGDERAGLIAHISTCAKCRMFVEDLAQTADALLLLGPEHEPPGGFESKVLAQFAAVKSSRRFPWLGAAAAIVAALIAAGSVLWVTADEREVGAHHLADLADANGDYFGVRDLRADNGAKVGNVFAFAGEPSWLFVVFTEAEPGSYRVQLVTKDGIKTDFGEFELSAGTETWGRDISTDFRDIAALRFVTHTGDVMDARFDD